MHHGYYGPTGTEQKDRYQAQIDLIEVLLQWANVQSATTILDVGCGIGGSSLYLAEKFDAIATGITLSPVQAQRAKERAEAAGMANPDRPPAAAFQVANALEMPFPDNSFDLVWSLESGEHMPNKRQFLQECQRVLKPGGRFILVTWCHRSTVSPAAPLTPQEKAHLDSLYRVYKLPYIIALDEYAAIAQQVGFQDIQTADWSAAVAPFWDEVILSALNPGAIWGLLRAGWTTVQAALSMRLMSRGYQRGLIKYGLLQGSKY